MAQSTPTVTRVYQNHHLDSTRWELFEPRDDDIVVTTSYKSGTTWTQQIVFLLLGGSPDGMAELMVRSPWIDARFHSSREELAERLRNLEGRRFVKSHLPLDGLPWYPQVKYLIVGRDPRDVFMSFINHWSNYTELAFAALNDTPGRVGEPLPTCPEDPREAWRSWMTRGWFEWESEGYPFWGNLHHVQTYWSHRSLPNFLFLHYADMLKDLEAQVRRIAGFLDIDASDDLIEQVVESTTFANVKKAVQDVKQDGPEFFRGGANTFFHKGTNRQWVDVLTGEDLSLYEAAKARVLTPECAEWLERGNLGQERDPTGPRSAASESEGFAR